MRITKGQLKSGIRESIKAWGIKGNAQGPGKGQTFLELTMGAMAKGDYKKASSYIMDSFMMDDVWPEEEAGLIDALSGLQTARRSHADVESVADQWMEDRRAGKYNR